MYVCVYVCMYVCNLIWLMEVAGLFATVNMSLSEHELQSLRHVSSGDSNEDLRELLGRPEYKPKRWMRHPRLKDYMTLEERWSNNNLIVSEWWIEGAYVM
jgi:hypothetical protein